MQTNWLDALELAGDYWELEALQDLCSDCTRLSRETAEDMLPEFGPLVPTGLVLLSTAASDVNTEPWKLPAQLTSRSSFKGKKARLKWTVEEDTKLAKLAKVLKKDWTKIAEHFTEKQPHELANRWSKKFDPTNHLGNWTEEEDGLILKLFEVEGSNWARIARHLPNRTPNSIKNRFYGTIRKKLPDRILEQVAKRGKWHRLLSANESEGFLEDYDPLVNSAERSMNSLSIDSRPVITDDERRERLQVLSTRMQSLEAFLSHTKNQIQRLEDDVSL